MAMNSNTSTLSCDVAKVERARRREYEKIEQVNEMYLGAKALGFPDKLTSELTYENYAVIVSIPNCFNPRYIEGKTPASFIKLRVTRKAIEEYGTFLEENKEAEIPNFVLWLLVCMKLFYKKDWDGEKWRNVGEAFKFAQEYPKFEAEYPATFSEPSQVSDLHEKIMKELTETLAKSIDDEIMKEMKKDPDHWHVQAGNTIYHGKKYLCVGSE